MGTSGGSPRSGATALAVFALSMTGLFACSCSMGSSDLTFAGISIMLFGAAVVVMTLAARHRHDQQPAAAVSPDLPKSIETTQD